MVMVDGARTAQQATVAGLSHAVHHNRIWSREGLRERLFTLAFRGLVYPQIWEDPIIDMEALALGPNDRVVTIASGGCNALSYLAASPDRIIAVDLNGAHVALTRLKLAAARALPDHAAFRRFFGEARSRENVATYDNILRPQLDAPTRAYWESRTLTGRRRIAMFTNNFYSHGLLGRFIGMAHLIARAQGVNPAILLTANSLEEQKKLFDKHIAPIFEKRLMRWMLAQPASLFGLGIPPAQFRELAHADGSGAATIVRQRLERLACNFDIKTNYFAWQAFGRGYDMRPDGAMPPYLQPEHFDTLRKNTDRVDVMHGSLTTLLQQSAPRSLDAFVLLDAQDWMNDGELSSMWRQITRTARPGARVIFRTAADRPLLPGRVPAGILDQWTCDTARSRELGARDRSAIYGAFHLYTLEEKPS